MIRRLLTLARLLVGSLFVAAFSRVRPHRWLPPAISLRLLRTYFEPGSAATGANMRATLPAGGRSVIRDLTYDPATGRDGRFDLVVPDGPDAVAPFPLVVLLHGGGYYYGAKEDVLPYAERLALHGFACATVNYPRIPEHRHPAAPRAVTQALLHLRAQAAQYRVDPDRIALVGDSAGGQVAAAVALACTSAPYAARLGVEQAPPAAAIRGVALFGSTVDAAALMDAGRAFTSILASSMWALSGARDWLDTETADLMTLTNHLTPAYPPTFLRAGNADPLTARGTTPMATRLRELGAEVDFEVPGDDADPVHHQYQFRLGTPAAEQTFTDLLAFLKSH
ncbi:MAG: alpha/beta hydrolase [Nocardioidaceae bacterium]|nr:alpha/beta hydrolase [Nocardioidaceae bacterium]